MFLSVTKPVTISLPNCFRGLTHKRLYVPYNGVGEFCQFPTIKWLDRATARICFWAAAVGKATMTGTGRAFLQPVGFGVERGFLSEFWAPGRTIIALYT